MVRTLFAFPYDLRMLAGSNIDQARVATRSRAVGDPPAS